MKSVSYFKADNEEWEINNVRIYYQGRRRIGPRINYVAVFRSGNFCALKVRLIRVRLMADMFVVEMENDCG